MEKKLRTLLMVVAAVLVTVVMTGCGKPPTEDIAATKAAADAVMAAGAEAYAPEIAASVKASLGDALAEVKLQDEKTFKNYEKAKQMLASAKAEAEKALPEVEAKKEEAKQNAMMAQQNAQQAVTDATALLAKAPKGKGTTEDVEALKADVQGLEESLPAVQQMIDSGDYKGANEKATAIEEKAREVSAEVENALAKSKARKKGK